MLVELVSEDRGGQRFVVHQWIGVGSRSRVCIISASYFIRLWTKKGCELGIKSLLMKWYEMEVNGFCGYATGVLTIFTEVFIKLRHAQNKE